MGYECRQLQNYTSCSWNSRTTTKNSRVANARRQTVPSHIISKTLRTLSGAKLHRQSMQDNKLGDDKKEWDHRMFGANWRSSDMNDASRQIEKLTSTWPWQGVEQWPDTWDKATGTEGRWAKTKFAVFLLSTEWKTKSQWRHFFRDVGLGTEVLILHYSLNKHFDHAGKGTLKPEANRRETKQGGTSSLLTINKHSSLSWH